MEGKAPEGSGKVQPIPLEGHLEGTLPKLPLALHQPRTQSSREEEG